VQTFRKRRAGLSATAGLSCLSIIAYINELATILRKHGISVHLFADDVKLYLKIFNVVVRCTK